MFCRNPQIFNKRILKSARDAGVEVDIFLSNDVAQCQPSISRNDDIVEMLSTNSIGQVRECAPIMREQEAEVRKTSE